MIPPCDLGENDMCLSGCNRRHHGHYRAYALGDNEKAAKFRAKWRELANKAVEEERLSKKRPLPMAKLCGFRGPHLSKAEVKENKAELQRLGIYVNYCVNDPEEAVMVFRCQHPEREPFQITKHCQDCDKWEDKTTLGKPADLAAFADEIYLDRKAQMKPGWWLKANAWEAFRVVLDRHRQQPRDTYIRQGNGEGIVMAGGGVYFPSAWCNIRLIRHHGCQLPIELWYFGSKDEMPKAWQELVKPYGVRCIDADEVRRMRPFRILRGWELKPYAVANSHFRKVLSLDADCHPMKDPTFMMDDPRFLGTGAQFFRDLGKGVGANIKSAVQEFFGLEVRDEWAFESGAFAIDKEKWKAALNMVLVLNEYSDMVYKVLYGDKDTFQIGARLAGQEYAIPPHAPGGGGKGNWGLIQHWWDGSQLFQHRIHCKLRLDEETKVTYAATPQRPKLWYGLPWENEFKTWLTELRGLMS